MTLGAALSSLNIQVRDDVPAIVRNLRPRDTPETRQSKSIYREHNRRRLSICYARYYVALSAPFRLRPTVR